ncbi:unnamed protein product [Medioppia subpectinata]|uniref:Uncharacterized protein n=1 Tax=Medioppia subpectinata TaxID=1979941 RepID=A0A7R9KDI1_9ACAR|nr:unnamed protein product [Medioppia subpectinata]CAG2101498.1 unnamed protein product [Medioppia subpectinata]
MMVSGGAAACIADMATFPLDVTKVRLQISTTVALNAEGIVIPAEYKGFLGTFMGMARNEGLRGLYGGIVPGLQRQCVLASIRIGLYEPVKELYTNQLQLGEGHGANMFIRIISASTTGTVGICFAQPTDVVKVRMQAQNRGNGTFRYYNSVHAYRSILKHEGLGGLWKGFVPNIVRNSVVNVAELVCYDTIKEVLINSGLFRDGLVCHFSAGLSAGFCATLLTSPIDVVKTRYMNSTNSYSSVWDCTKALAREGGFLAFYKGFIPAFMRLGTWNVCMFVTFEQLKKIMYTMNAQNRDNKISVRIFCRLVLYDISNLPTNVPIVSLGRNGCHYYLYNDIGFADDVCNTDACVDQH